MLRRSLIAATAFSALASHVAAAAPRKPAVKPAISVATLKTVTRTLSSDAYEGRAPTTRAEAKTIAYIADRFAKAGLKPGNKGSWFQKVPLVEITADPSMTLSVSGGKEPLSLAYKADIVASSYRVVPQTDVKGGWVMSGRRSPA